jgi:hypothetical protein
MSMRHADRSSEHGQALALFALALTAIVLAAAVVVDGGYAYAQRRQAQNAADFAAMAGTRIIGEALTGVPAGAGTAANVDNAIDAALAANDAQLVSARYVDNAGVDLGSVVGASIIPDGAFGVVVGARTDWEPFLLGVIGVTDWAAAATATAITPGDSEGGGVLPIGIERSRYNSLSSCPADELDECLTQALQQSLTPGHLIGPGNFGWLSFGLQGNGGKCDWEYSLGMKADGGCEVNQPFLQSQIWPDPDTHGCCTAVGSVDPDTGAVSEDKIGALTGNEWGDLSEYIDHEIPVWVPIYDGMDPPNGAKAAYNIVGFGAIILMGEDGSQHARWLQGAAIDTPWCAIGGGDKFCLGPDGPFEFDVTGEVQLRR